MPKPATPATAAPPVKLRDVPHLPNAYRVHPRVISGGLPDGEAGFEELGRLGVKTVISVDGMTPAVELAKAHGMRYVHLPHGYDGVPEQRVRELAKALRQFEGPIYIHCHHGKHRSPAATAAACVTAGLLEPSAAKGVLTAAGTSEKYRGLFASAENARPAVAEVDALTVEFPETAKLPPMAEAMVAIEHAHDRLKQVAAAGWKPSEKARGHDPAHEALLLGEHFTELLRSEAARTQPEEFLEMIRQSEAESQKLERMLSEWQRRKDDSPVPAAASESFAKITAACAACHQKFRDVPLGEKTR